MNQMNEATKQIINALNAGQTTITEVLENLPIAKTFVKAGTGFRTLTNGQPLLLNGELVKVYELGPKQNGNGDAITPKPRKVAKAAKK
jgi:predicted DNA-binding ArsR family transcriptional regulator